MCGFDDIVVGVAHSHLGRSATSRTITSHLYIDLPKHRTLRHHSIAAAALLMHPTMHVQ